MSKSDKWVVWLTQTTAEKNIFYSEFLIFVCNLPATICSNPCNLSDDHCPSLPRPALHRDHNAQHSWPQKSGQCRHWTTSVFPTRKSGVLPPPEAFPVLYLHSGVCVRKTSTSLQNTLWAGPVQLWTTDEQVWLSVARVSQMWNI